VSIVLALIGLCFFIYENLTDDLSENVKHYGGYIYVILTSMVIVLIWELSSSYYKINKSAKELPVDPQTLSFRPQRIELAHFGEPIIIFTRDIKGYLVLKKTVFLVSTNKKSWPIRINPNEVSESGMSFIMTELNKIGIGKI
jgi:hypothetical protein